MDVTDRAARVLLALAKKPDAMAHLDGMQIKVTRQELERIVGRLREMVGWVLKIPEEQGPYYGKGNDDGYLWNSIIFEFRFLKVTFIN